MILPFHTLSGERFSGAPRFDSNVGAVAKLKEQLGMHDPARFTAPRAKASVHETT